MKYKIIYDKPGRIRLRMGQQAFSTEQGYGIELLLISNPDVLSAETSPANGSILVSYKPGCRDSIISIIDGLDKRSLPVAMQQDINKIRELDNVFFQSLASLMCKHYVIKLFVPAPIRIVYTLQKAFFYWKKGWKSLMDGKFGVDVLDATAIAAAIIQNDFKTASSIMTLLHTSELLEDYSRKKAKQTLTQSLALHIDGVWLVGDNADVLTPVAQIQIGDRIRVRTGGVIPLDGEVVSGEALVNESSMTGEPLAVMRTANHSVYAGTVVDEGSIIVKVRTLADNSRIQNIVSLIDQSEALKASIQSKAEKLADSIVPFSFLTSIVTLALTRNLTKAMSVLMVDYSCAIKLTTPICIISAMHEAAKHRILVKGGKHLEACANANTVVFDKTGTLTTSCPEVSKVVPFGNYTRDYVLKTSACLEEHFPHSVARAIVKLAESENLQHGEEHAEVQYVVAHGISSMLYGERVLIGSGHFIFDDEGIQIADEEKAKIDSEADGCSTIFLAIGGKLAGMICVEDPVRLEAAGTLAKLRKLGTKRFIMLTGDSEAAAQAACDALGIDEFYAQILPEDKADIIRKLKKQDNIVLMVGDGINDAPALSCADVSVAMKDGSDIAKEVADITLLSENLDGLIDIRIISRTLFERINRNYRFILGINTTLLFLGIAGIIAPSASAVLHNVSTMALSATSMRPYLRGCTDKS